MLPNLRALFNKKQTYARLLVVCGAGRLRGLWFLCAPCNGPSRAIRGSCRCILAGAGGDVRGPLQKHKQDA